MKMITALVIGLSALLAGCNSSGPVLTPHISEASKACAVNGGLAKIDDAGSYITPGDPRTRVYSCEATCNNGGVFNVSFSLPRGAK